MFSSKRSAERSVHMLRTGGAGDTVEVNGIPCPAVLELLFMPSGKIKGKLSYNSEKKAYKVTGSWEGSDAYYPTSLQFTAKVPNPRDPNSKLQITYSSLDLCWSCVDDGVNKSGKHNMHAMCRGVDLDGDYFSD